MVAMLAVKVLIIEICAFVREVMSSSLLHLNTEDCEHGDWLRNLLSACDWQRDLCPA